MVQQLTRGLMRSNSINMRKRTMLQESSWDTSSFPTRASLRSQPSLTSSSRNLPLFLLKQVVSQPWQIEQMDFNSCCWLESSESWSPHFFWLPKSRNCSKATAGQAILTPIKLRTSLLECTVSTQVHGKVSDGPKKGPKFRCFPLNWEPKLGRSHSLVL